MSVTSQTSEDGRILEIIPHVGNQFKSVKQGSARAQFSL